MEALTKQLQVFMTIQNQQYQPQYDSSDEGLKGDDYREVPQPRRRLLIHFKEEKRQDDIRMWESGKHIEVPEFQGSLQPEVFID